MLVKFEKNRVVEATQNFEFFDKKWFNHFWKSNDAILKTFLKRQQ